MIGEVNDAVVDWGKANNNQSTIKATEKITKFVPIPDSIWNIIAEADRVVFEKESDRSRGLIFYK